MASGSPVLQGGVQAIGTDEKSQELGPLGSSIDVSSTGKSWQLGWGLPPEKSRTQKANLSRSSLSIVAERTGRPMARPVRPHREPARAGVPAPLRGRTGRTRRADTRYYHTPTRGRSCAHDPRHPDAGGVGWTLPSSDWHGRPPLLRRWSTCPTRARGWGIPAPSRRGGCQSIPSATVSKHLSRRLGLSSS